MKSGWYPRRREILDHLESGEISLLDAAVHDFLCLTCNYKTGVARTSAVKINALCPTEDYRAIKRSLQRLERLGWIKRFMIRGKKGNYPVVISRFFVRDASLTWWSVNTERTTDWRTVEFDRVPDGVLERVPDAVPDRVPDDVSDVTPLKEVRSKKPENTDDDDLAHRKKRDEASPQPKIHPKLRAWARTRILLRAGAVTSPHGYVRNSMPEFLDNLHHEVQEYLTEKAELFLAQRLQDKPGENVQWADVSLFLNAEALKHGLPVNRERLEIAMRAGSELLGLVEKIT